MGEDMTGQKEPLRIVQSYYTATSGTADGPNYVTEDGRHWRKPTFFDIGPSGQTATGTGEIRHVKGGYLW